MLKLKHIGMNLHLHACSQRLLYGDTAVVLRIDGTHGLAVIGTAAWRATIKAAAIARHGVADHVERAFQAIRQALHGIRHGHFTHGERLAAGRAGLGRAAHTHDFFDFLVVGLQIVIVKRPVLAHAIQAVDAEVIGHIAPCLSGPVPAGAAHLADVLGLVGLGTGLLEIVIVFRAVDGVRSRGDGRIRSHPVATTRGVVKTCDKNAAVRWAASFKHEHRSAGASQLCAHHGADDAGTNNDKVCR